MIIDRSIKIFTGNANPVLAQKIAKYLGIPLGKAHVGRFSDGEVAVDGNKEGATGREKGVLTSLSARNGDGIICHRRQPILDSQRNFHSHADLPTRLHVSTPSGAANQPRRRSYCAG